MEERAQSFAALRPHLRAVAYRMLGSLSDADDAVQEAWLRLSRAHSGSIANERAWLTTVVARICLDMLRSRRAKPTDEAGPEALPSPQNLERDLALADSMGPALLVVLETLNPSERVAFVLHDLFGVPFEDVASVLERTPMAVRQMASRARRRVLGAPVPDAARTRQREVVSAFLAASRQGDFAALVALLHPDVRVQADAATVAFGAPAAEMHGAETVAGLFKGQAKAARLALVNGKVGAVWVVKEVVRAVIDYTVVDGDIVAIDLIMDETRLAQLEIELLTRRDLG